MLTGRKNIFGGDSMSWRDDLMKLKRNNPPLADFADKMIQLRYSGGFSTLEAMESALGHDLAYLLLTPNIEFDKIIQNGE